jgi:hypothetical protein
MWMQFLSSLTQPQAVLLAGLVGACGALLVATVTQVLTFRGQDKRRWEETRRLTYARFYSAVTAAWDAYDQNGEEWEDDETISRLRAEIRDVYSETSLIVRTRSADRALYELHQATAFLWSRRGRGWEQVERQLHDATGRFLVAARKELGMPNTIAMESYEEYKATFRSLELHDAARTDADATAIHEPATGQ